jgi:hypothetical protein
MFFIIGEILWLRTANIGLNRKVQLDYAIYAKFFKKSWVYFKQWVPSNIP